MCGVDYIFLLAKLSELFERVIGGICRFRQWCVARCSAPWPLSVSVTHHIDRFHGEPVAFSCFTCFPTIILSAILM
jgi:hypothetical protein